MSHSSKKPPKGLDTLSGDLREALSSEAKNKPDVKEQDLKVKGSHSPISPLRKQQQQPTSTTTTTSTSSSSGGSKSVPNTRTNRTHSGDISGSSSESSPRKTTTTTRNLKTPGGRSHSVTSPAMNVLPAGNICPSGKIMKSGIALAASRGARTDVLGSGTLNYGHGNIMRCGSMGGVKKTGSGNADEITRDGDEQYRRGKYAEALKLYDRAVSIDKGNAAYRSNRAAGLTALGRLGEAVRDFEEALRLDSNYWRAHHRLGSLFVRLGHIECASRHLCIPGPQPDPGEIKKLQSVEKHLNKCADARRVGDWKGASSEVDAAIAAGADCCPQVFMFRTEILLKLHQLEDAESSLLMVPRLEPFPNSCSRTEFFGMLSEAYLYFVRAQIDMAMGRFDNAVTAADKSREIDPRNVDVAVLNKNVKLVARARARGNDLFKSDRLTEACAAYGEGLRLDPSNSVLYCNRAACYFKLGQWERSIDDSSQALRIRPNYMKALCRRAACNNKLERWEDAVRDYEILRRLWPSDNEIAEALFYAEVALKKSRGEEVYNMKFGGDVEVISGLDQFKAAISLQGVSVVYFKATSDLKCKQISPFVDMLCGKYPSVNFHQVDIEESATVADNENVRIVPTFKIYKNGSRVKEMICPSRDMLEHSVRHYSI